MRSCQIMPQSAAMAATAVAKMSRKRWSIAWPALSSSVVALDMAGFYTTARGGFTRFRWRRSALHERVDVRGAERAVEIAEGALVLHLAGGVDHARHRQAIERRRQADAP